MSGAVFAIPGDKDQRTGGYIYDATVLRLLNEMGCPTRYLQLPGSFPFPPDSDLAAAHEALVALPAEHPVIVDGLALGAMDPARIATVAAPIIALVHHPLGLETGLAEAQAQALIRNEAQVLNHVAHVIVTSLNVARTLTADLGVSADRITVAQPGVDPLEVTRAPVTPPLILSVGLLSPRKGHDVLIEALALIQDLDWQADIVGRPQDPDFRTTLQEQVEREGLSQRVRLVGEVSGGELQAYYQRASLFALATRYEGYGMVMGEAMMHGLPIVTCAVGAVPETVGGTAALVPPDQPAEFARAMRALLENPTAAAEAADVSLTRARSLPSWRDTARQIARVIKKVTP